MATIWDCTTQNSVTAQATNPTYPVVGDAWWNTTDSSWYYWDGMAWVKDSGGAGSGIAFLPDADLTLAPTGGALNPSIGLIIQHNGPAGVLHAGWTGVAGDKINPEDMLINDGAAWIIIRSSDAGGAGAPIVTADTVIHVEVTGNDTTGDGFTVGTAYATVQKAINSIQSWIILDPAFVTIQLGAGDFTTDSVIRVHHPYGLRMKILGQTPVNSITGIVEADFTNPLVPVPGVRGTWDLYNSAGMLPTDATGVTRTAARAQDKIDNEALLRTVYTTRILNSGTATSSVSFQGSCADFSNILCFKGLNITGGGMFSLSSYAVIDGGVMNAVRGGYASLTKVIGCGAAGYSLAADTGGTVLCTTALFQGGGNHAIAAQSNATIEISNATISGCGFSGMFAARGSRIITPQTSVVRRISISGCGSYGVYADNASMINFSVGAAGSVFNVAGNVSVGIYATDSSSISVGPDTVTTKLQAHTAASAVISQTQSNIMFDGPIEINSGMYGLRAIDTGKIHVAAAITFTNPGDSVIRAEQLGVVSINGAVTAAAGLGTTGIYTNMGGKVLDAGNVLSALAATYPTKFTPTFGKTRADGSAITGGPVGTGAITIGQNNVKLHGGTLLDGNMELVGNRIMVTDALDAFHGALGYSPTVEALFLSENTPGEYFEDKAGISFHAGLLALHGSRAQIKALVGVGNREVWVDPDGGLYPVEPAPPAWDAEDQSTAKVAVFGDADGTGAWTKITGLVALTEQPVNAGDAVGCTTRAYINNLSSVGGDLEFGWGIGAAEPAVGAGTSIVAVVPAQKGYVTANQYQEALADIPAGTEVQAWVRALGTASFGPWIDGLTYPHYLTVEAVGGASTGDVIVTTDRTVYVEVTGNDTTGDGVSVSTAYATLQKAIDSIQHWIILEPAYVTIQLGAGDFTISAVIRFYHPYGPRIKILGQTPTNAITGIVEADFTDSLNPVPGTRGTWDLYNSAGMLATSASASTRTAARAQDLIDNEALLRTVYATRIYNNTTTAALSFASSIADFGNILFNKSINAASPIIVTSTGSFAVLGTVNFVRGSNAQFVTVIIAGASSAGLSADSAAFITTTKVFIQGSTTSGIYAAAGARIDLGDTTVTGCGGEGIWAVRLGAISTLNSALARRISSSGHGAGGCRAESGGIVSIATGGTGSLFIVAGNASGQLFVYDEAMFNVSPETVTTRIQAASTAGAIRATTKSRITLDGPVELNRGVNAIWAQDASSIVIAGDITLTNPGTTFITSEAGSTITIKGSVTAAAGLGTTGVVATTGGKILDAGNNILAALATTYPTKFTPTFGKTLADGSSITGGPAGTAGLLIGATAVTLGGSSLKAEALAGTGSRAVVASEDGTFSAMVTATKTEMEVGTETALRAMSPLTVRQGEDARLVAPPQIGSVTPNMGFFTALRLHNTTDTTVNFERLSLTWLSNTAIIGTTYGGTGTSRNLQLMQGGLTRFEFTPYQTNHKIPSSSMLVTYGTEQLTAGGWTAGTGWVEGPTGTFTHSSGTATLAHSVAITNGDRYHCSWTVTGRTAGSFVVAFGGYTSTTQNASGSIGHVAVDTATLVITPTTDFNGVVTFSLKRVSGGIYAGISWQDTNTNYVNALSFPGGYLGRNIVMGGGGTFITSGDWNTGIGTSALSNLVTGKTNSAFGAGALVALESGGGNAAIGGWSLGSLLNGTSNVGLGGNAGRYLLNLSTLATQVSNCIFIGSNTTSLAIDSVNQIVIGYSAQGLGTNTTVIGNSSVTKTRLQGVVETNNDFESITAGKGVLLRSPNGTRYRISVNDAGAIIATAAP